MHKIDLQERDIPVIKSSLELKKRALEFNLTRYREHLEMFEKQYNMSSKNFLKKFDSGELGDDPQWFEWQYFIGVFEESVLLLNHINKIQL